MGDWKRVHDLMDEHRRLRRLDMRAMSVQEREQHKKRIYDLWQEAKALIEKP